MTHGNFEKEDRNRDDWRQGEPVSSQDLRNLAFWNHLWNRLGTDHLDRVAAIARRLDVPGNMTLFDEGDAADTVYFIIDGRVSLSLRIPGREDAIVGTLSAGELLGWSALLPARVWTATARALAPTPLLAISGEVLVETCELDHEIGFYVMRSALSAVAGRLRDARVQLLDMFGTP